MSRYDPPGGPECPYGDMCRVLEGHDRCVGCETGMPPKTDGPGADCPAGVGCLLEHGQAVCLICRRHRTARGFERKGNDPMGASLKSPVISNPISPSGHANTDERTRESQANTTAKPTAADADDTCNGDSCDTCHDAGIVKPELARLLNGDPVDHPNHYGGANDPFEAIKVIEAWDLGFNLGNALKYIRRAGNKTGAKRAEDLAKAAWYVKREANRQA